MLDKIQAWYSISTQGHYWIGRAKMVITCHRFISLVGDDQEQYYQQKIQGGNV